MIIDAHCHWLPEEIISNAHFFSKAWGDIEAQVEAMEKAGIQKAVLTYPTTDAHRRMGSLRKIAMLYNERVAAIVKFQPERFIGAAILPVDDAKAMVAEFRRATQDLGFRGVSLATSTDGVFLDDERYERLYEEAQKYRVPIFVHPQIVKPIGSQQVDDPLLTPVIEYIFETTMCVGKLLMAEVFQRFPDLTWVFAYFGGVTPFIAHRYDATYGMLRSINFVKDLGDVPSNFLRRIYVDTSGDRTLANYISSLELFGAGHILWGSDYPARRDIGASIGFLDSLSVSDTDKKSILGGNLERILKQVKL